MLPYWYLYRVVLLAVLQAPYLLMNQPLFVPPNSIQEFLVQIDLHPKLSDSPELTLSDLLLSLLLVVCLGSLD